MKNSIFGILLLAVLLVLSGCGDPGASTSGTNSGSHVTDSTTRPGPSTGGKSHPYSESDNLLDPNRYEFFSDLERHRLQPFNAAFIRAQGIRAIRFNHADGSEQDIPANATEQQVESSGSRSFEFDANGRLTKWENNRLLDGTPLLRTTVSNEYDQDGKLISQAVTLDASGNVTRSTASFSYDEGGRLLAREDQTGVSMYYGYDDAKGHTYELQTTPGGGISVHVYGKPGDFPNETCKRLQNEILSLGSKFVPYNKAGGLVRDVIFYEQDGRKTSRQVNMGVNGEIDGEIKREYNEFSNLLNDRLNWKDEGALFRSEKVVRYLPSNDPERIVEKLLRQQGEALTRVWHFQFGPSGLLEKLSQTSRKDNGPEVVEAVDFVRYEMGNAVAQPGEAVPGASR